MASYSQITLVVALAMVALCTAAPGGYGGSSAESYSSSVLGGSWGGSLGGSQGGSYGSSSYEKEPEIIAYPLYNFKYGVEDPKTGDYKDQAEERDGDKVRGEYSLLQPDGRKRLVKYDCDKKSGCNTIVSYSGHAVHPQEIKQIVKLSSSGYGSY